MYTVSTLIVKSEGAKLSDRKWFNLATLWMTLTPPIPNRPLTTDFYVGSHTPMDIQDDTRTILEPNGPTDGPAGLMKRVQFKAAVGQVFAHTNATLHNVHPVKGPCSRVMLSMELGIFKDQDIWKGLSNLSMYPVRFPESDDQNYNWPMYRDMNELSKKELSIDWIKTRRQMKELKRGSFFQLKHMTAEAVCKVFAPIIYSEHAAQRPDTDNEGDAEMQEQKEAEEKRQETVTGTPGNDKEEADD